MTWRIANDYLVKDTTYICYSLASGHEYEFRIRAKNAAGFSKPSPHSAPFKIKGKFNVPSPPGTPHVTKVGKNYVDLKWEAPVSDGGSRITGYVVEKREVGSAIWIKCNDYNVTDTEYTVLHLIERGDYEFRIFAVNAAGRSEPSSCTTPVKICEVEGGEKPEFVRNLPISQIVPLGKTHVFECEATGKPLPSARLIRYMHTRYFFFLPKKMSTITMKRFPNAILLQVAEEWSRDHPWRTLQSGSFRRNLQARDIRCDGS